MPEWSIGAVSKTVERFAFQGFESLSLRKKDSKCPNYRALVFLFLHDYFSVFFQRQPIFVFLQQNLFKMNSKFNIRPAKPEEAGLVLEFIKKLAVYEKCADEVVADEVTLHHSLFVEHSAEVVFAEEDSVVIGFALFFHNFSTFVGRKGLYLEDLFIIPENRGKGYGKALLKHLAQLAV